MSEPAIRIHIRQQSDYKLIRLGVPWASLKHADRALAQFEDCCVVTQSVRAGIDVAVRVVDGRGAGMASG